MHIQIDYHQADGQANLGSGQAYSIGTFHRVKHIAHQLLQVGIVRRDILCFAAQHGLSVDINR